METSSLQNCLLSRKPGSNHSRNDKTRNFTKKALLDFNLLDRINSNACCLDKHVREKHVFSTWNLQKTSISAKPNHQLPNRLRTPQNATPKEKNNHVPVLLPTLLHIWRQQSQCPAFPAWRIPSRDDHRVDTSFPIFGMKRRHNSEANMFWSSSTLWYYRPEPPKSTNPSDGFPVSPPRTHPWSPAQCCPHPSRPIKSFDPLRSPQPRRAD